MELFMMILYLRSRLLENLRMLPHAPGVQMADIPEDSVDLNKEKEAEDEGGEADKDKRLGVKIMDKRVEPENEFESGEDFWISMFLDNF